MIHEICIRDQSEFLAIALGSQSGGATEEHGEGPLEQLESELRLRKLLRVTGEGECL